MTDKPSPSVEEVNMVMGVPGMDAEGHKKLRDEQEKMNHERMAEIAAQKPTPSVEELNKIMGAVEAKAEPEEAERKTEHPEHQKKAASAEGNDATYKTRASTPKEHK